MSKTIAEPAKILTTLQDRLAQIDQEIAQLEQQRALAFVAERDDWHGRGYEAHILPNFAKTRWQEPIERRHLVRVVEIHSNHYGEHWKQSFNMHAMYVGDEPIEEWGPYSPAWAYGVKIERGEFFVSLADDQRVVVVKVRDIEPTREQYARAVARLRAVASRVCMRVSVRDRAVKLTSPMNDIVHEGDIVSAYLWLVGVDVEMREQVAA